VGLSEFSSVRVPRSCVCRTQNRNHHMNETSPSLELSVSCANSQQEVCANLINDAQTHKKFSQTANSQEVCANLISDTQTHKTPHKRFANSQEVCVNLIRCAKSQEAYANLIKRRANSQEVCINLISGKLRSAYRSAGVIKSSQYLLPGNT